MNDVSKARVIFIFFIFLAVSGTIAAKLYILQIKNGQYYEALALGQQISFKKNQQQRGGIFFQKEKVPLAETKIKNIVYFFGDKIIKDITQNNYPEKKLSVLSKVLNLQKNTQTSTKENIIAFFQKNKNLKKELSEENFRLLVQQNIKGIGAERDLGRVYPQKTMACHIVGFVNEDGKGQYGIEGYYDETLKSKERVKIKGKSPFGYLTLFGGSQTETISQEGADVYLTLDYNIQYFSEKILQEAKEKWNIDGGTVIVEEPSTGKILALSNYPSFDPNSYFKEKDLEVFQNSAIQKTFEPGSVFKPITMAAGLEEGLIAPDTKYKDEGFVNLGGPPIYNYQKRVWGEQTMTDVLEESINTGAVFVEQKLGPQLFLKYIEKFGFFEKTGIDLQGEVFSANESLKNGYPRDFAVASFGQGIRVTPIQIVRAFGAIANGGKLMRPYIVDKIIYPDGKIKRNQPTIQRKVISEKTASTLTSMMVSVVENGSARKTQIKGYFIAGKTGTAQVPLKTGGYSKEKTIHSFIGFFPAFSPKVLIFIKLDNPKGVNASAYSVVPLFKELAQYIINLWQIPPDYQDY